MTYEYECTECSHHWEEDQKITSDPIKTCPKCKSETAKRLISLSTFQLKGPGWSSDNYGS